MNKERRAELYDVISSLDEATDRLQEISDDEEETYDNLSPGLQYGKTGESIQNSIEKLQGFVTEIDNIKQKIENMAKGKK